jgi:hypothetical protein
MKINGVLHNDPAQILLTGGGALFGPLRKEIEKNFTCPVELLNLISARQLEVEKNIMMRMNPSLLNAAAANALRSSAGKKSFNFRQGEFTARPSHLNFKNHLRWAGILAAVIPAAGRGESNSRLQPENATNWRHQEGHCQDFPKEFSGRSVHGGSGAAIENKNRRR